jgi:hypothetical protein
VCEREASAITVDKVTIRKISGVSLFPSPLPSSLYNRLYQSNAVSHDTDDSLDGAQKITSYRTVPLDLA